MVYIVYCGFYVGKIDGETDGETKGHMYRYTSAKDGWPDIIVTANRLYKAQQIQKLKFYSSRLAVVIARFIDVMCSVENKDVGGEAPTGDAPITSEESAIL